MALSVRKFTFATRFCDVFSCAFPSFLTQSRIFVFHCALCVLSDAAFSLCLFLHCTRSFAAPSATKNSADGSSEPICAVPLYGLVFYSLRSDRTGYCAKCNKPRQKGHGLKDRRTEQKGRTSGEALPLAVLSTVCYVSPQHLTNKKEERLRRAALPQFRLCY